MKRAASGPLRNQDTVLVSECRVAKDFLSRFLGLMGRKSIPRDEALFFPRCNSIHTFFMRFSIDVVLLDQGCEVVDVVPSLKPWRLLLPRRRVAHVIELAAGRCEELGIRPGNRLACEGALP